MGGRVVMGNKAVYGCYQSPYIFVAECTIVHGCVLNGFSSSKKGVSSGPQGSLRFTRTFKVTLRIFDLYYVFFDHEKLLSVRKLSSLTRISAFGRDSRSLRSKKLKNEDRGCPKKCVSVVAQLLSFTE